MNKKEFLETIRKYPELSQSYNNSDFLVEFPSSFGIYQDNGKWHFYEIDERQNIVCQKEFESEHDAYFYASQKYGILNRMVIKRIHQATRRMLSREILNSTHVKTAITGAPRGLMRRYGAKVDQKEFFEIAKKNRQRIYAKDKKDDD